MIKNRNLFVLSSLGVVALLCASAAAFSCASSTIMPRAEASEDSYSYDYSGDQVKANIQTLGVSDPLIFSNTSALCVGTLANVEGTEIYTIVYFPNGGYLPISAFDIHIGTEKDANGVFMDTEGLIAFSKASVTECGYFQGVFGSFYQYQYSNSVAQSYAAAQSVGVFRVNVHAIDFSDEGMDKTTIAEYRNFQSAQTLINLNTKEIASVYDRVIVVGDHYEAFQLFNVGSDALFANRINELSYSCFSFAYDDYQTYGQLEKIEVQYDYELFKGDTNYLAHSGFGKSPADNFCDEFKGLPQMSTPLAYDKKVYGYDNIIENEPVFISYQKNFWDFFYTGIFASNTIKKISDISSKGYDLSDDAKKYQYMVIFDQREFWAGYYLTSQDTPSNYWIGDEYHNYTQNEAMTMLYDTNFSYIRFWFEKNGQITEYKAFDDKVKDGEGNKPFVLNPDWWDNFLEWLKNLWAIITSTAGNFVAFLIGVLIVAGLIYLGIEAIINRKD